MKTIALVLLALLYSQGASAASPVEGFWTGTAVRGGQASPVSLHVVATPTGLEAHYNLPALGVEGIPLRGFSFDQATGRISGSRAFQGRLSDGRIVGELNPVLLHGQSARLSLTRSAGPPSLRTIHRPIEFRSRGYRLRGWLVGPRDGKRHPAIVSLHGSGPSTRWLALARARRFAEAGYVMLIFDKPGSGESEGDWTMTSLDEMAQDAVNAIGFLRSQPEVDVNKVGLWGHSQAGHIISRAGAMPNSHIAFAIVLAGGGASAREVEDYGYLGRLHHAGASGAARERAMAWVQAYYDYVRTGEGYDRLVAQLRAEPDAEWVRALNISTVYPTPQQQPKWKWVATYDPSADIRRLRFPLLLLFADQDQNLPSERSLSLWRESLREGGNRDVEWRMFRNVEHHFLTPPNTEGWPALAPGFYEIQIEWLNRHTTPQ